MSFIHHARLRSFELEVGTSGPWGATASQCWRPAFAGVDARSSERSTADMRSLLLVRDRGSIRLRGLAGGSATRPFRTPHHRFPY